MPTLAAVQVSRLDVTRNSRENARQGGANIFTDTFLRHQIA